MVPILYEGFEAAILQAREFFDSRELDIDPYLFPHLVRFFVKRWLDSRGQNVEYELDELANNGLGFAFVDWDVRILKAANGRTPDGEPLPLLPAPGRSEKKQAFYGQQLRFRYGADDETGRFSSLNVVILWDVTSGWNVRLYLACPKRGGNSRGSVELHWPIVEIPMPMPATSPQPMPVANDFEDLNNITAPTGTDREND